MPNTYAVLGATGNCGTALIENLLKKPDTRVHAYCRNQAKLLHLLPEIKDEKRVEVFEGSVYDIDLLASCIRNTCAIFLVISTNDNVPRCHMAHDTAIATVQALHSLREASHHSGISSYIFPKLVLLSSATIDEHFSRHVPYLLRQILLYSASHVYHDLVETEKFLRGEAAWLKTIFVKPGALSVDIQRGHALSLTEEESPVSYLDLAAAMIEAVDDQHGLYDGKNVSVVNTNGKARFPTGTPMCILMGLLRHFFPFLHPYLPSNTSPR